MRRIAAVTLTVLVPLFALASGCLVKETRENLVDALRMYNAAVRWGAMDRMAEHVAEEKRGEFLARRKEFGDLQVTDCEVGQVTLKGKEQAVAMVRIDWYLTSSLRLYTSFVEQRWRLKDGSWQITEQRLVRGAPYPLLSPVPGHKRFKDDLWPQVSVAPPQKRPSN
jgi:hypothetical protein